MSVLRRRKRGNQPRYRDEGLRLLQDRHVLEYGSRSVRWTEIYGFALSSRFRIGMGGKIKGRSFRVLGRLVYAHKCGTWNEWFVELQDGKILWLTEDEGELFLESPLDLKSSIPPHSELKRGMKISLNDTAGIVEEIGEARCLGGEGGPQLNEPANLSLVSGVTISWYFIFPIVAAFVFVILEPLLRWNFEQRRCVGLPPAVAAMTMMIDANALSKKLPARRPALPIRRAWVGLASLPVVTRSVDVTSVKMHWYEPATLEDLCRT